MPAIDFRHSGNAAKRSSVMELKQCIKADLINLSDLVINFKYALSENNIPGFNSSIL